MTKFEPCIYSFDQFELDSARFELRRDGERQHVEPQVLSLLILLAQNHGRMVSKDELIEKIWSGRIVSETAIAARLKAARRAIGDTGSQQRLIRTIHGKGLRFVAELRINGAAALAGTHAAYPAHVSDASESAIEVLRTMHSGRPSIAVLPFQLLGEPGQHDIVGDALPAEIIAGLSQLYWLFVIARGTSFRFRGAAADPILVGRQLAVRYCLAGSIELSAEKVTVSVALADTASGGTIWAENYRCSLAELPQMRPEIEAQVVARLAAQIQQHEVRMARRRPAMELDAWSSFHLGLDHLYRFTQPDNLRAAQLFEQSLERDPWFSQALGGLSFSHFQNAFLQFGADPSAELELAQSLANRALQADRLDPFAHFNMGRCSWLEGRLEESMASFDRATLISPSFAQGLYNRGLVATLAGRAEQADADLVLACQLSPLDPLAYAMISSRALVHIQLNDYEKAADFGRSAAMMPGAHKHIELIAAITAQLTGNLEDAERWLARARRADPNLKAETFFRSFPFACTSAREVIERSLADLGL